MRTSGSPAELEHRRRLAVERVLDGYSTAEVADFLGVDPSSVRRWVAAFQRQGAAGLAARPVTGRPPKLTSTQEKIIRRWLAESPTEHGFATQLWTAPRLAQIIEQEWGVHFHPDYLTTWLRQRGFTPQKPRRKARERDEDAIARWLDRDWPRIKKKKGPATGRQPAPDGRERAADGPLVRRSWALRGHPPVLKQKARHREKVSVAAALWLTPLRDRLRLAFQTLVNGYFNNEAVADFLEGALQGLAEPIIVIWDGGTMHKGHPIKNLVAEWGGRLDLEPLPAHAPELMPVEQLWTWLKYSRLCNFAPEDAEQLNEVVIRDLEAIREDQERLRSFFHASDLPLPRVLLS